MPTNATICLQSQITPEKTLTPTLQAKTIVVSLSALLTTTF